MPQTNLQLELGVVPDLAPGATDFLAAIADSAKSVDEVVGLLEPHPVVALRLVGLANSVWSSPVSRIDSLSLACARLGLGVVRSAAIAYAVAAPFQARRCPSFDAERFWCCTLLTSEAAELLSRPAQAGIARTAGMARNLGLLWLASAVPEQTDAALHAAARTGTPLAPHLQQMVGISHHEATAMLMDAWHLRALISTAHEADGEGRVTDIVRHAHALAEGVYLAARVGTRSGEAAVASEEAQAVLQHLENRIEDLRTLAQNLDA